MKKLVKQILIQMCVLFTMFGIADKAYAQTEVDTDRDVTLTISYRPDNEPLVNAAFEVYKVAESDAYTNLTPIGQFATYGMKLTNLDNDAWRQLAMTLSSNVKRDNVAVDYRGTTDASGQLVISGTASKPMKAGLYLVVGNSVVRGDYIYKTQPILVFLPNSEDGKETFIYDTTIAAKFERSDVYKPVTCKVLKIWKGDNENDRPKFITVDLYRDGIVYETVQLNEENRWSYTWTELSGKYEWTVSERDVPGYTMSVNKSGVTFTITNTKLTPTPTPTPGKPPQIPHTGQLWWPVVPLFVVGFVFVILGRYKDRNYE